MSKGKKDLFKNITSLGIVQIANYVFPLISIPIISRIIEPEKFGIISYASAFCAYFSLIIGFGFDLTGTRQLAMNPQDRSMRNRLFSEIFLAKCLLLVISVIFFCVSFYYSTIEK
jgi:PST family polysaccharide transporter